MENPQIKDSDTHLTTLKARNESEDTANWHQAMVSRSAQNQCPSKDESGWLVAWCHLTSMPWQVALWLLSPVDEHLLASYVAWWLKRGESLWMHIISGVKQCFNPLPSNQAHNQDLDKGGWGNTPWTTATMQTGDSVCAILACLWKLVCL